MILMRWAFFVAARPGELLSGYLCRAAAAHGATPFSFIRAHLNDKIFWARDIDRGAIPRYEDALGHVSGLGSGVIRSMTLLNWMHPLTPATYAKRIPAIAPWVNASGVFHRTRRLHSLQFCSQCLAETGVIEKTWRLSFVVACAAHRTLLADGCPRCDAPFMPHRGHMRGYRCHNCSTLLAGYPGRENLDRLGTIWGDSVEVQMQLALYSALSQGCDAGSPTALAELRALRGLAAVLLSQEHSLTTAKILQLRPQADPIGGRQVETMRLSGRRRVLQMCGRLMADWPSSIRAIAGAAGLRQEAFFRCGEMPSWLHGEVERLPVRKAHCTGRAKRTLDERVERLRVSQPVNWRADRAALMWRAAQARR